jgi:sugar lactone lactonase YvrE
VNLGGQYDPGIQYHHRRWFPEEYRGIGDGIYTTHDFFSDLFTPSRLGDWLDFWVRRTLPAAEPGTVDGVAYFPKGTGVVSQEPTGPTVRVDGTQLVIGGPGSARGQLTAPSDVAFDAGGNIYIADTDNNRVQKYDRNGVFQAEIGGFSSTEISMNQPWSVAVGADGSVFVADTWNHKILKFNADLSLAKEWGSGGQSEPGGDPMKLFGPREIVVMTNGNVMVADTGNARIIEYTADGEFVRQFGGKAGSGAQPELNEPVGIVTNLAGDIYVADFWNKRVLVLGSDLAVKDTIDVPTWGSQAVTDRPYMALLADGRLLVTDPANGKVLAFASDGSSIGEYVPPKEERAAFVRPVGIATDGESVVVVDSGGNVARKIGLAEVLP